ncbi:toll-like receptor 2 [Antedon mediterranea]|uniref:toll-like receptor 2 n=1 Tax=Antedon mediterranea TaxID=105859 RepID=UPI003AF4C388
MTSLFVCYKSKDTQWVLDVLQPSLEEQRNFKLCVDYRDFLPGEEIATKIENAVKFGRKVLLVVKSEWCNFELEMAHMRMLDNHEYILIVVLLEKVSHKDMLVLLHNILTGQL